MACRSADDWRASGTRLGTAMNEYDSIPYRGLPIAAAHPWRLAWTSFVYGGPRPELAHTRVLEIGCGDGATLLPLAAHQPTWRVHGIDAAPAAIAFARTGVATSRLDNATFACADLAEVDVETAAWDIVIAHGVYSWIDAERRLALRRLVRRVLAPNGLAYISFNALPGWSVRGRVRDILRRGAEKPLDVLDRVLPNVGTDAWGRLLASELQRAQAARDDYLAHEYLAATNDAFWLGDFVRDAATDGLRWLGDAQFDLPEGRPYEQLRATLAVDGVRGAELADLIGYRQLHCAVLARDDAPCESNPDDAGLVETAIIAGVVAPTRQPFVLDAAAEELMQSAGGVAIHVRDPLAKASLLELARIYPDGLTRLELLERARRVVRGYGIHLNAEADRTVTEGVVRLWRAGALELRLHQPQVAVAAMDRPLVSAFTRYEASVRPAISSRLGVVLPIDAEDESIISKMEGARTKHELCEIGGEQKVGELLALLARWGVLVSKD